MQSIDLDLDWVKSQDLSEHIDIHFLQLNLMLYLSCCNSFKVTLTPTATLTV